MPPPAGGFGEIYVNFHTAFFMRVGGHNLTIRNDYKTIIMYFEICPISPLLKDFSHTAKKK